MCSWSESCLMMLCSAKQISSKSPCKQQFSPLPSKICACRWEGAGVQTAWKKGSWSQALQTVIVETLSPPRDSSQHFYSGYQTESFESIFQKGGTDFAATTLSSHQHAWKRTSFNLTKESSCFCGLSIFDLSTQIDNEVVKLVLVKMTISWWAQTAHLRPTKTTKVLQLHPNH